MDSNMGMKEATPTESERLLSRLRDLRGTIQGLNERIIIVANRVMGQQPEPSNSRDQADTLSPNGFVCQIDDIISMTNATVDEISTHIYRLEGFAK